MSTKDWKNKELNTLLNEKWGFSMNLNKLNEGKVPDGLAKYQKEKAAKKGDNESDENSEESEEETETSSKKHSMKGTDPKNYPKGADSRPKDGKISGYEAKISKKINNSQNEQMNEGESELEEIKNMVKQNFESEELDDNTINQIAKMIKAKRDKNKPPPKSGGNSGSGAPAQASMQERKLREAIRRIIRSKLNK